jgi:coenzyme F420-0:L-glutamate ligase/coenzyme F420-1:gamma-L-glutamate ligase
LELLSLHTGIMRVDENVTDRIRETLAKERLQIRNGDILAITSKVIAVSEGQIVELDKVIPSRKARNLSNRFHVLPEICELILKEADTVIGGIDGVILTLKNNTLIANAGIDKKNAGPGKVVLHPSNSPRAAERIRNDFLKNEGKRIGVIITDSRTQPLRVGTIGVALAVCGFEPLVDERGKPDLYGRPLQVTRRALADELATAAEILMGETNECVPAVLIRDAPINLTDKTFSPSSLFVPPNECFYTKILSKAGTIRGNLHTFGKKKSKLASRKT